MWLLGEEERGKAPQDLTQHPGLKVRQQGEDQQGWHCVLWGPFAAAGAEHGV